MSGEETMGTRGRDTMKGRKRANESGRRHGSDASELRSSSDSGSIRSKLRTRSRTKVPLECGRSGSREIHLMVGLRSIHCSERYECSAVNGSFSETDSTRPKR